MNPTASNIHLKPLHDFAKSSLLALAALILGASPASAAIAQRGVTTSASGTTAGSVTVAIPSGVVAGDVVIVSITKIGNADPLAAPANWTVISQGAIRTSSSLTYGAVMYHVATGAEGGTTVGFTLGITSSFVADAVAFSGVDATGGYLVGGGAGGPFDVVPAAMTINTVGSTSVTVPSITTTSPNAAVIMCGTAGGVATWAPTGTWSIATTPTATTLTEIADHQATAGSVGVAWVLKESAGATGAGSVTLSGAARNGCLMLALKPAPTKDMLTFSFGALGDATITGTNITMTVPYGTDVTAFSPTYTMNGVSCDPLSPPATPLDFTNPVHYIVTATDSTTNDYTVTVTVTPISTAKDILTFGLPGLPAGIDQIAKTVTWHVPGGTNLATLAPAYTVSPFANGLPPTGIAPNFATTNPATYTITAQDGSTQAYLVRVLGVTETDVSASFAAGSTGYQANVPGTAVNLLALPGTTLTPSDAAPATPSLDPDRAYVGTSASWSTLTDGSVGTVQGWLGDPGEVYIHDNWTLTYTFDSPRTIGDMDVFTRWSDGGRKDPRVTIKYSIDGSNFTSLHAINYAASGNCAWVHLSDILVPGVVAVQFAFGAQQNGAVGYAELCVRSGAPNGLVAAPLPSGVRLDWTASHGATGYDVYRGTATGSYATDPVGSTTSATTYTDTGLTAGVPYYYVVKATNLLGASFPSNEASASPAAEPVNQTITFALGSTVTKTAADAPFADPATAYPSGLPVTYSVPAEEQSVATVNAGSGLVTLTGVPGTAHVVADAAATAEYHAAQASQTLTVVQAMPVITWVTPETIEVGTLLSGTQLNATSDGVDGTFTYDPPDGTALAVGTHTLSLQFTPANTVKYSTPAPKTVSILVIPVPQALINLAYNNSMDGTAYWQQKGTASQVAPMSYTGTTWNDGGNGSATVSNLKKSNGDSTGISVSAVLRPRTSLAWGAILGGNKLASAPAGLGMGSYGAGDAAIMSGFVDVLTFSGLAANHSYNIVLVDPTGWPATFKYLSQSMVVSMQTTTDWVSGKNYALLTDCIPNASGEITIQETISHDWSALCGFQIVDNGIVPQATLPFSSWITAYYATPSDPNAAADADPDGDGLKNSIEYVLGSLPNTSNQGGPSASTASGNLVFTFQRALASQNPDTKVAIEVSTDLGVWIAFDVDTAPEVAVTAGLDADHETVTLTLPMTPDTTKFARLRVAVTAAP